MPRGLGFVIVGILAVIGGAAFIGLLLRNKLRKNDDDADFDEFDGDIDDIEFEEYFSGDDDADEDGAADIGEASEVSISTDEGDSVPAGEDDDMHTNAYSAEIAEKQAETEDNGPAASTEPEEVK